MTNQERIEAVAWIAAALDASYGKTVAALTRPEVRKGYRLYLSAKKTSGARIRRVPEGFLAELRDWRRRG